MWNKAKKGRLARSIYIEKLGLLSPLSQVQIAWQSYLLPKVPIPKPGTWRFILCRNCIREASYEVEDEGDETKEYSLNLEFSKYSPRLTVSLLRGNLLKMQVLQPTPSLFWRADFNMSPNDPHLLVFMALYKPPSQIICF